MKSKGLIFDIGTNKGEDALFYAHLGYEVIAVDADPSLVEENKRTHAAQLDKITFLNYAISETDGDTLELFINSDSGKNSLIQEVGARQDSLAGKVAVKTITLRTLVEQYGLPHYIKIDIEGYDAIAVRSLIGMSEMPPYISVEAECLPEDDRFSEEGIFETLDTLRDAGYTRFKLIDQATLRVLDDTDTYYRDSTTLPHRVIRKAQQLTGIFSAPYNDKKVLEKKYGFALVYSASGPFGEESAGEWMTYEEAKRTYLFQRRQYFSIEANRRWSYWADWHAAR